MTLTEAHVAKLRSRKSSARPELSVPRKLVVLRPGAGLAAAAPVADVTDDFFELTESDLHSISLASGTSAAGGTAAPAMQTAAMRELARLQAMRTYSHARVRVRLPGGLLVEASYHPQEPVRHVLDLAISCMQPPLRELGAYLFTTPPRTELDLSVSLVDGGLAPAATVVLAWREPLPPELAERPFEELLADHARELLAAATNAPPPGSEGHGANFPSVVQTTAAAAAASSSSAAGGSAASAGAGGKSKQKSGGGEEGGEGGKSKPKWLKM